jgi:quercetin dioxygenase-like cupin family protein
MTVEAIVLARGAGEKVAMRAGTEFTFKVAGKRPADGPTVIEIRAAPGFSTGDHVHSRIEELFYVLEGVFNIRAGDKVVKATRGDFVAIPPGVAHGFGNAGDESAALLGLVSPAGVHDQYVYDLAEILAKPGPPDVDAIAALRRRYDTTQVSPLTA